MNVDYRLAPEHKMPASAHDFVKVIRYVHENAESLGADKSKVVIAGYSGGAMVACVAAHILSKTDE